MSLLALLGLAAAWQATAATEAPSDEAVAAVALPEPQLRNMLARTVFTTQSMAIAAYTLGVPRSCELARPAFERAVAATLPRWRANLIAAYRDNVPADVLRAAAGEGALGGLRMGPYMGRIGAQMQKASQPLLIEAGTMVLTEVTPAVRKVDSAKVDGTRRKQEMEAAIADGTLFCGLLTTRPQ